MTETRTLQQAVLGEILPNLGRRSAAMAGEARVSSGGHRKSSGALRALSFNVMRVPQSVVKRVGTGGCHNPKELRRQMTYILRDEAKTAAWSNQIGIDRSFGEAGMEALIRDWSGSWCGAPKRGHTDHIILSFPKGTDAGLAEDIARDWAQEVFGSGDYFDRFRYVAALHCNTEHVHAHFIVDKVGMEEGRFLSVSRHSEINFDMMRTLHAQIAQEHGLALNATSRLSRGIVENAARETDVQAARKEGREPHVEPLTPIEVAAREDAVRQGAQAYRQLARLAQMGTEHDPGGWLARVADQAQIAAANMERGDPLMRGFADGADVPPASNDVVGRLIAARETLMSDAESAWTAIREMEPGAERVELEQIFAGQARELGALLGSDFLQDHASTVAPEKDPYFVSGMAALHDRAQDAAPAPSRPRQMRCWNASARRCRASSHRWKSALSSAGTSVEEIAARFATPERSVAQLEASRPDEPEARQDWLSFERDLQLQAKEVFAALPIGRDLLEDLARQDILDAGQGARLADLATLGKLIAEIRQDLSDGDLDQVAAGRLDPLMDRIQDPGLRQAVFSELRAIASLDEDQDIAGRDSEPAATYRARIEAFDAPARDRDERDADYEL